MESIDDWLYPFVEAAANLSPAVPVPSQPRLTA
jgi:hypothetical protein